MIKRKREERHNIGDRKRKRDIQKDRKSIDIQNKLEEKKQ